MAADKKPEKKGKLRGIWNTYEKKGDTVVKKNKSCPKCGSGFSLAAHKDRLTCGFCQYAEFTKVSASAAEAKPVLPAEKK